MRSIACAQHEWIKYLPSVSLIFLSILIVYVFSIPNPMIILMIPIVYATYSSGYLGGALTGCVAFAYSVHFFLVKTSDPSGAYKSVTIALSISVSYTHLDVYKRQIHRSIHTDQLLI